MSGDQASTTAQFELGESWLAAARITLIRDGDGWKVDGWEEKGNSGASCSCSPTLSTTNAISPAVICAGVELESQLDQVHVDGAGNSTKLVLTKTLEAGRYAFVCFLPDTDEGPQGTPHAFKGMVSEFTVP